MSLISWMSPPTQPQQPWPGLGTEHSSLSLFASLALCSLYRRLYKPRCLDSSWPRIEMETEETPQWRKPKLSHEASNSQFQLSTFNFQRDQTAKLSTPRETPRIRK